MSKTMVKLTRQVAMVRLVCSECWGVIDACEACEHNFNYQRIGPSLTANNGIICDSGRAHYCRACDPKKQVDKR